MVDGAYRPLEEIENVMRSNIFRGLWLNLPALIAGDAAAVLQTLQQGIDSEQHQEFVKQLKQSS